MNLFTLIWEVVSYYKLGNDLFLMKQGNKNPIQAFIEVGVNEYAKKSVYSLLK